MDETSETRAFAVAIEKATSGTHISGSSKFPFLKRSPMYQPIRTATFYLHELKTFLTEDQVQEWGSPDEITFAKKTSAEGNIVEEILPKNSSRQPKTLDLSGDAPLNQFAAKRFARLEPFPLDSETTYIGRMSGNINKTGFNMQISQAQGRTASSFPVWTALYRIDVPLSNEQIREYKKLAKGFQEVSLDGKTHEVTPTIFSLAPSPASESFPTIFAVGRSRNFDGIAILEEFSEERKSFKISDYENPENELSYSWNALPKDVCDALRQCSEHDSAIRFHCQKTPNDDREYHIRNIGSLQILNGRVDSYQEVKEPGRPAFHRFTLSCFEDRDTENPQTFSQALALPKKTSEVEISKKNEALIEKLVQSYNEGAAVTVMTDISRRTPFHVEECSSVPQLEERDQPARSKGRSSLRASIRLAAQDALQWLEAQERGSTTGKPVVAQNLRPRFVYNRETGVVSPPKNAQIDEADEVQTVPTPRQNPSISRESPSR